MKKTILKSFSRVLIVTTLMLFTFFVIDTINVSAQTFKYESGTVSEKYNDTTIISFGYDYTTKFEEKSEYGDNNYSLPTLVGKELYAAREITINIDHHLHILKSDKTVICKYVGNNEWEIKDSFVDKTVQTTLKEEGIYDITYFDNDGNEQIKKYVYVSKKVIDLQIEADTYYDKHPVVYGGYFKYNLYIEDAYSLSGIEVCAFFGKEDREQDEGIKCTSIYFDEEEIKNKNKNMEYYNAYFESGEDFFFYVEIYRVIESVRTLVGQTRTEKTFVIEEIQVDVYLVDDNGEKLGEGQKNYSKNEAFNMLIEFSVPLSYKKAKYYFAYSDNSGKKKIEFDIGSSSEEVEKIKIEDHKFKIDDVETIFQFGMDSSSFSSNGMKIGEQFNVINHFSINYDTKGPQIAFTYNQEEDFIFSSSGVVSVTNFDASFDKTEWYVDKCSAINGNVCEDNFDDDHVAYTEVASFDITFDKKTVGEINGESVWVFVKAYDKKGNSSEAKTNKIIVDNTIVPKGLENELFFVEDIDGNKQLKIKIYRDYNILTKNNSVEENHPSISAGGTDYLACGGAISGGASGMSDYYKCFSIDEEIYISMNMTIKLHDMYGNTEEHSFLLKNNPVVASEGTIDGYNYSTVSNDEYDMLVSLNTGKAINGIDSGITFTSDIMRQIDSTLLIPNNGVKKDLIYKNGSKNVVLNEISGNEVTFPSLNYVMNLSENIDKYRTCAFKGNTCNIELYLKYEYTIVLYDELFHEMMKYNPTQIRYVKLLFKDNSNKYLINNFNYSTTVEVGETYDEINYTLFNNVNVKIDEEDVVKSKKIIYTDKQSNKEEVEKIDVTKTGIYTVTESFEYGGTQSFPLNYVVIVQDSKAPVVTLKGDEKITIRKGDKFEDPLVEVSDNYDSEFEVLTEWNREFDENTVGEYTVSYWVVDSSGNKSNVVTRTIVVESDMQVYLIVGGIVLAVILIIVLGAIFEVRRKKKRA